MWLRVSSRLWFYCQAPQTVRSTGGFALEGTSGHVFCGLPSSSYADLVELLKLQREAVEDEILKHRERSLKAGNRSSAGASQLLGNESPSSTVEAQLKRKQIGIGQQLDFVRSLSLLVDNLVFHAPKVRPACCTQSSPGTASGSHLFTRAGEAIVWLSGNSSVARLQWSVAKSVAQNPVISVVFSRHGCNSSTWAVNFVLVCDN